MTPDCGVVQQVIRRLEHQGAWESLRHLEGMSMCELRVLVDLECGQVVPTPVHRLSTDAAQARPQRQRRAA